MSIARVEAWLSSLIGQCEPASRRELARKLSRALRSSQLKRIRASKAPDGSDFQPRAARSTRRRRRKALRARLFEKLATTRYVRAESSPDVAGVSFAGRSTERIARVHQYGLRDRVERRGNAPEVKYPQRRLLGLSDADQAMIETMVIDHLAR